MGTPAKRSMNGIKPRLMLNIKLEGEEVTLLDSVRRSPIYKTIPQSKTVMMEALKLLREKVTKQEAAIRKSGRRQAA